MGSLKRISLSVLALLSLQSWVHYDAALASVIDSQQESAAALTQPADAVTVNSQPAASPDPAGLQPDPTAVSDDDDEDEDFWDCCIGSIIDLLIALGVIALGLLLAVGVMWLFEQGERNRG